jgi:lambda family phage portal protein
MNPTSEGVNALLFGAGDTLRRHSRQAARENIWAGAALDSFVSDAIGAGIKPRSRHPEKSIRQRIHQTWNAWTDEADAAGLTDYYGLQAMLWRETMEGGEAFVRKRPRLAKDGLVVPLQLQGLEAEHLPATKNEMLASGNVVRAGIEFNKIGRREAYHLYREHPGEMPMFGQSLETVRVPAADVLHVFRPLRLGQLRGEPWLSRTLVKLWEMDKFDDATLARQAAAAMFTGFIQKKSPEDNVFPGTTAELSDGDTGETAPDGVEFGSLEALTIQELLADEELNMTEPPSAGDYEPFIGSQIRAVGRGAGLIPYENLSGDLSGVNYSSIRAGLVQFRRFVEQLQWQMMIFQFCRPTWRSWIDYAILSGALPLPKSEADRLQYYAVDWRCPKWAWVDPLKDVQATILEMRAALASRSQKVAEGGYDAEDVDEEIAADNARADQLGIASDADGRRPAKAAGQVDSVGDDAEAPPPAPQRRAKARLIQ